MVDLTTHHPQKSRILAFSSYFLGGTKRAGLYPYGVLTLRGRSIIICDTKVFLFYFGIVQPNVKLSLKHEITYNLLYTYTQ